MSNEADTTQQKNFHAKFGNKEYYFHMALYNNEGHAVLLKKSAVMYFELEDNIFNPFESAVLIISNNQNLLEKSVYPYVFLGNGRDIVDLEIIPLVTGNYEDHKNEELKDYMSLKFKFVVTSCTEISYNDCLCKKMTLVEYSQYMLSENICNIFGLQKAGGIGNNYLATNGENSKSTGDVIKSIIYAVYNDGVASDDIFYKDKNGNIIFESESDSKVSINPYGLLPYSDILAYVLQNHTYKDSPCLLSFDRYQKKFQLISLNSIFRNHNDYLYESLVFPAQAEISTEGLPLAISWNHSKQIFDESRISNFFIESPTSKYNIEHSSNSGVLSFSSGTKSMLFDLQTLNSDNFTTKFNEFFIKPFQNLFEGYKLVPNFYLSPNKKNNYNTYSSVLPENLNENKFLNQKLNSLLYLNNVYQFSLDGMTFRKSMTFLDVLKYADKTKESYKPNVWDLNNLGRHFVVSVKHIFTQETYRNEIETIKPYRFESQKGESLTGENLLKKM